MLSLDSPRMFKYLTPNMTQVHVHNIWRDNFTGYYISVIFFIVSSLFCTVCEGSLFPQVDIEGKAFVERGAVSDKHCQMLCSVHPQCTYFSYVRYCEPAIISSDYIYNKYLLFFSTINHYLLVPVTTPAKWLISFHLNIIFFLTLKKKKTKNI